MPNQHDELRKLRIDGYSSSCSICRDQAGKPRAKVPDSQICAAHAYAIARVALSRYPDPPATKRDPWLDADDEFKNMYATRPPATDEEMREKLAAFLRKLNPNFDTGLDDEIDVKVSLFDATEILRFLSLLRPSPEAVDHSVSDWWSARIAAAGLSESISIHVAHAMISDMKKLENKNRHSSASEQLREALREVMRYASGEATGDSEDETEEHLLGNIYGIAENALTRSPQEDIDIKPAVLEAVNKYPALQSVLYDENLLPECIRTENQRDRLEYFVAGYMLSAEHPSHQPQEEKPKLSVTIQEGYEPQEVEARNDLVRSFNGPEGDAAAKALQDAAPESPAGKRFVCNNRNCNDVWERITESELVNGCCPTCGGPVVEEKAPSETLYRCTNCGERNIPEDIVVKRGNDWYHYRRPTVSDGTLCGPVVEEKELAS